MDASVPDRMEHPARKIEVTDAEPASGSFGLLRRAKHPRCGAVQPVPASASGRCRSGGWDRRVGPAGMLTAKRQPVENKPSLGFVWFPPAMGHVPPVVRG